MDICRHHHPGFLRRRVYFTATHVVRAEDAATEIAPEGTALPVRCDQCFGMQITSDGHSCLAVGVQEPSHGETRDL